MLGICSADRTAAPIAWAASSRRWRAPGRSSNFIIPLTTERQGYLNLKSYWEFRQPEPARRLERLGHIRDLAGGTDAEHGVEANAHEMTALLSGQCPFRDRKARQNTSSL
jgi:hypothetical protein